MQLNLLVSEFTENSRIGELTIEEEDFKCHTLEDADRDLYQQTPVADILRTKSLYPKKTAIPYGTYEVVMTYSNRFKRIMPLLLSVPGFEGIRIHNGNTAEHSEGCILLGYTKTVDFVGNSRAACAELYMILADACAKEKVWITIKKDHAPPATT